MCFDSQWCETIEMVFEGVTALNLRPAGDNYTADVSAASLIVKDASVFFCGDGIREWDENYEGTWITAYSLRWRFVRWSVLHRNIPCRQGDTRGVRHLFCILKAY
jgi:hypothetical protein